MPMILPFVGYALIAGQLIWGPLTTLGAIIAYSSIAVGAAAKARKAQRKALDAYNASLRDQTVMVKGGVVPRQWVYGRTAVAGNVVYATTTGSKKEFLHLVIPFAMGEIDAVESLYFNDELVSWDPTAGASALTPVGGRFTKTPSQSSTVSITVPGAPYQVTIAGATAIEAVISSGGGGGDNGAADTLLQNPADYTVSGNVITFNSSWSGKSLVVTYTENAGSTVYAWVRWYAGTDSQTADADLIAAAPNSEWTTNHRLRGIAYLYVRLYYDETVWATGIPNIKIIVRGRKIYDPRSGLTVWSRNPALIARDYLRSAQGLNLAAAKINDSTVISAANICDELVQIATGVGTLSFTNGSNVITGSGTSFDNNLLGKLLVGPVFGWIGEVTKVTSATSLEVRYNMSTTQSGVAWNPHQLRYSCDGVVSSGANRRDNLNKICDSMAGSAWYSQGQWRLRAGASGTPSLSLSENDLSDQESISIVPYASRKDLLNGAKATFLDMSKGYVENQAPEWSSPTLLSQDNNLPLTGLLTLPMTTDGAMAQRLSKIMVLRTREAMVVRAAFKITQYRAAAGDLISVTMARYGLSNTTMRIVDRTYSTEGSLVLTMREELQSVYDWNLGEAINLPVVPNASLPNYFFVSSPSISAIQSGPTYAVKRPDGSAESRVRIVLNAPTDQSVISGGKLQIQYRDASQSWKFGRMYEFRGDSTEVYLENMVPGAIIQLQARYMNNIGAFSVWSQTFTHSVISPYGAAVTALRNTIKNSDFTDYTGTNSGAAALRGWTYFEDTGAGWTGRDGGRNYGTGLYWNVGLGGAWLFDTGNVGTNYRRFYYQDIPWDNQAAYEVAFVGSAHRCRGLLELNFLDGAKSVIGAVNEVRDAGLNILGGANLNDYALWWLTGTPPAGTAYIRLIWGKYATNSGASNSYVFVNKLRLYKIVAPSPSRQFPLPWVDGGNIGSNGGGIDTGTVDTPILTPNAATEIYEAVSANSNPCAWDQQVGGGYLLGFNNKTASLNIACKAGDRLIVHASVAGITGNNATWAYPTVAVDVYAGTGTIWRNGGGGTTGNLQQFFFPLQATGAYFSANMAPYQYTVTADGTINVQAGGGLTQGTTNTESGYVKLRVERIKR